MQQNPDQNKPQRTGHEDDAQRDKDRDLTKKPREGADKEGQNPGREQRGNSGGGGGGDR